MPLEIRNITAAEALELLEARFPGEASMTPIRDSRDTIRGYELKVDRSTLIVMGGEITQVMVELFADGFSYGRRKEILRRARRASRPNHDAQAAYDAQWGTDNGGLVDYHSRNR